MTIEDLRALLKKTFASYRAKHREAVAANGPMREEELETIEAYVARYDQGRIAASAIEYAFDGFLQDKGLALPRTVPHYEQAATEHGLASRDYRQFMVDHSRTLKAAEDASAIRPIGLPRAKMPKQTLRGALDIYKTEMEREQRGTEKTRKRRTRHMELLREILGDEMDVASIAWDESRKVKSVLTALPAHRTKKAKTREKSLEELIAEPAEVGLHIRTINSHLSSYGAFFHWAKLNGYVAENPFAGIAYNTQNADAEDPRVPFTMKQLAAIRDAVMNPAKDVPAYHKWGVLIAMHTGARLNEVAQLHLADIVQRDGIWCFDINMDDKATTRKRLKNRQSARLVPMHPYLKASGLLEYVEGLRNAGRARLFPEYPYTASDGYGRNLGRWVNGSLLPALKIKTDQLTFHSLRHSMVERLVALDVSQAHIMAIVGHEPGTTTLKVYNRNGFPPQQLLDALSGVTIAAETDSPT